MALYALGDFHLSFGVDKAMDIFGRELPCMQGNSPVDCFIAGSSLNRNVTIKGGVVMRSKTKNIRRATQDLDIDFIRYSLADGRLINL